MNAKFLPIVILLLLSCRTLGQKCGSGDIELYSQTDVNEFPINYPDCSIIDGDLLISSKNGQIYNLDSLIQIERIEGNLKIWDHDQLSSFTTFNIYGYGLANLKYIGGNLEVEGMRGMGIFHEFGRLDSLLGDLSIVNCPSIFVISSFSPEIIGGDIIIGDKLNGGNSALRDILLTTKNLGGNFQVYGNHQLKSIGLIPSHGDTFYGSIILENNKNLFDLSALTQVDYIKGNLVLKDLDKFNGFLSGLDFMDSIGGYLEINNCSSLTALYTHNPQSIGGIRLLNNKSLKKVEFSDNLRKLNGSLVIQENPGLIEISGLKKTPSINGNLTIANNISLNSLEGFESLSSINGSLTISTNSSLVSLRGLDNLDPTSITELNILDCPNLSICNVESVCKYLNRSKPYKINGNTTGCESKEAISELCKTSIRDVAEETNFQITQDYADGSIRVSIKNNYHMKYSIYNLQGQLMKSGALISERPIVIGTLKSGVYIFSIDSYSTIYARTKFCVP